MSGKNCEWSKPVPICEGDEKNPLNYSKLNSPNRNLISDRNVFLVGKKVPPLHPRCRQWYRFHPEVFRCDRVPNLYEQCSFAREGTTCSIFKVTEFSVHSIRWDPATTRLLIISLQPHPNVIRIAPTSKS
jgi:hypothetical protein